MKKENQQETSIQSAVNDWKKLEEIGTQYKIFRNFSEAQKHGFVSQTFLKMLGLVIPKEPSAYCRCCGVLSLSGKEQRTFAAPVYDMRRFIKNENS